MKKKALNYRSLYFEDLAGHYESIEGHPAGLQIIFFLERKFVRLSDHFGRTKQTENIVGNHQKKEEG